MPYLGLRARISLAWLAYPIMIIILIMIQLILTLSSVDDGVADAKRNLAASCAGFEGAASVAASIPHFMAEQTNEFIVSGAESIVHGLAVVLDIAIHAIEAIILYVVDTYRSLYQCLAEFVVRGSLALLISAAEEAEKVFAEAVSGLRTALPEATIGGAESIVKDAINTIDKIPGVHIKQPDLRVPDLAALQNFKVPTGLSDALTQLNSSLPTLQELRDALDKVISTPFEALRAEVNKNLRNATIDRTLLKAPPRQTVTFCQDLDTSFLDKVGKIISAGLRIIILILLVAIIVIFLFNVVRERFFYKRMVKKVDEARDVWLYGSRDSFSSSNLLAFFHNVQNPFASTMTNKLLRSKRPRTFRLPWFLAYITWPSALLFLGVGLLGLLVVEVQLFALHGVRNQAVNQANSGVSDMTNLLADKINSQTANISARFAEDTNSVIIRFQSDVNDHMLGWAGTTTTTLNNTLTTFYDGLTTVVQGTFGKTPLKDAALGLLNCLIGSKVAGIQSALTFVHDHAHVDLPTVSPTALMISPAQTRELVGSVGSTQADPAQQHNQSDSGSSLATRFVDRLIDRYTKVLHKQRITYIALLGCYLVVIIFSVIGVIWDILHGTPPNSIRDSFQLQEHKNGRRFQEAENVAMAQDENSRNGKSLSSLPPVALVSSPFYSLRSQSPIKKSVPSPGSNEGRDSSWTIRPLSQPPLQPAEPPEDGPSYPFQSPMPMNIDWNPDDMNFSYPTGHFPSGPVFQSGFHENLPSNSRYPHFPPPEKSDQRETSEPGLRENPEHGLKNEPKSEFSPITPSPSAKWPGEINMNMN
ncbi:hypothetical protein CROQUDRAFT_49155 [Cronartium quercuum f. sp. fusiforme G11]|uniref:Plasma membrane fusion protein PRM1 n=1 Tax=Cronartium quercuum f. sp. fusiforme G11 TaxID=708437 RepID=A0A9P6T8K3_9BASI|nr:hypothetical protein CROQUDRAFT_49155 [Cronartium quercuum f. sp. fusiforme G11]